MYNVFAVSGFLYDGGWLSCHLAYLQGSLSGKLESLNNITLLNHTFT